MSESKKPKVSVPMRFLLMTFFMILFSLIPALSIVLISFHPDLWEETLHVTKIERIVSMVSLCYVCLAMYVEIGTFRQIWRLAGQE